MYLLYRTVTLALSALMPLLLRLRLARGKEDAARLPERLGHASLPRPGGKLLWIHAASVGEANSAFTLLDALLKEHPKLHVLLTTVTVTSAALMAKRLESSQGRALHQFAPVDTPFAVRRFLEHWRPDIALWIDSELWPNLILEAHKRGALMGIVNARLSERSYRRWKKLPGFIGRILAPFTLCFAQTEADAKRLEGLGMRSITGTGNLKYDAPVLGCDENELARLAALIGRRPVWLAASTHPGEEEQIARVHTALKADHPGLLTLLVPRHADRGSPIKAALAPLRVAQRSAAEPILPETDIYLADTMGELGLFYRLAPVAFIGGSLVPHGGQNPVEAILLGCAVATGFHMHNFKAIWDALGRHDAYMLSADEDWLADDIALLLDDPALRKRMSQAALAHVQAGRGILTRITQQLRAALS